MSAIARYFLSIGIPVAGYDKTPSPITDALTNEGARIHFEDNPALIDPVFLEVEQSLVIYTPAIPKDHNELNFFKSKCANIKKRAQVLGMFSRQYNTIAVAGTHGKTSISILLTHLLHQSDIGCTAFVGGISRNFGTNYVFNNDSRFLVVEADEFDRSFHQLFPKYAIITAVDADHLDIYKNYAALKQAFQQFIENIGEGGTLIINKAIKDMMDISSRINCYTYSLEDNSADFYASALQLKNQLYTFSLQSPLGRLNNLQLGIPGWVNIENAIAATAMASLLKMNEETIRKALRGFQGVYRRFDIRYVSEKLIYIDDYAHHPEELRKFILSVREAYPGKKLTGIFQPHLYTRTRDFADGFAKSLELLDEIILTGIYPAREEPIPGVSSAIIFDKIRKDEKKLVRKDEVLPIIEKKAPEGIILTMGAGDIDRICDPIVELLKKMEGNNGEII